MFWIGRWLWESGHLEAQVNKEEARVGGRLELPNEATTGCGNFLVGDFKPVSLSKR
jgi:hypothetical protein